MAKHIYCPKCGSLELDVQCIVDVRLDFSAPDAPQMQEYDGWEYHGENPRVCCANCRHEGPLLRFEHDAPREPVKPRPLPVLVLGGNAYRIGDDGALQTAPVLASGCVPPHEADDWYVVDPLAFDLERVKADGVLRALQAA